MGEGKLEAHDAHALLDLVLDLDAYPAVVFFPFIAADNTVEELLCPPEAVPAPACARGVARVGEHAQRAGRVRLRRRVRVVVVIPTREHF